MFDQQATEVQQLVWPAEHRVQWRVLLSRKNESSPSYQLAFCLEVS